MWFVTVELDLRPHEEATVVRWKVVTAEPKLRIERVDFDGIELGRLYYRTRKLIEPEVDLETGVCRWNGHEHSVPIVRQTGRRTVEIPPDCGAFAGSFPASGRGRWLVFSPAPRNEAEARPGTRPPSPDRTALGSGGAPAVTVPASSARVHTGASDNGQRGLGNRS